MIKYFILCLVSIFLTGCGAATSQNKMKTAYIGTYTKKEGHVDGRAKGILRVDFSPENEKSASLKTVAEVVNPSFIKLSKNEKFLLAVSELGPNDAASGYLYSFSIENSELRQISKISTEGLAPAHIELDKTGKFVFVSNYLGGVVVMYAFKEDGSLEKVQRLDLENPTQSHAHSATVSPDNKKLYIADLGKDKIWIYNFDADKAALKPASPAFQALPEGAGPRHMSLSKNGKFAYSINELNNSVSVFEIDETGILNNIQNISSLPAGFSGKSAAADIHIHPSGKWLYASNRFHDSIAVYKISESTGKLEILDFVSTEGKTPRGFIISDDGNWLFVANQDSSNLSIFSIAENGSLTFKNSIPVPTPVKIELITE